MYYCPRCGTENAVEASFCRNCGADISLVPQALTGRLPATASIEKSKSSKADKLPSPEQFMPTLFIGVGFLLWFVIGAVFFTRMFPFWFWAIFPGFACLGSGVGHYMRYKREQEREASLAAGYMPPALPGSTAARANIAEPLAAEHRLSARDTEEIVSPLRANAHASVTEGTTRLLDDRPELAARDAARRERG